MRGGVTSVSCIADERDETTKLRAHDAAHCVLCAVCMCSVLCVCMWCCVLCVCALLCVCVVLCVLRFVRDTPHGRHADSPTGSKAIRNCANLSLPICRHPQSTTTMKRRNCGISCCQQRRNCGIRLAAAIINRSGLGVHDAFCHPSIGSGHSFAICPSRGSGHSPAYLVCLQLLGLCLGSLCNRGRVIRPRKVARFHQGLMGHACIGIFCHTCNSPDKKTKCMVEPRHRRATHVRIGISCLSYNIPSACIRM